MSSRPDYIFEIHQLWQSGFNRVYSNCWCSCSFEPEIIKIDQLSHKIYGNKILNFQESTTILNACTKKSENLFITYFIIDTQRPLFYYNNNNDDNTKQVEMKEKIQKV